MLGVLLALQAAAAPCAAPAPCRLLDAAAAANQAAMLAPGGYRATIETETSTLGRREGRISGATLLEQTSSRARWSSGGGFEQHVVGSRSFPNAIPLSRLAFLRIGWVMPTMSGERLPLIARSGPGETSFDESLRGRFAAEIIVHPLASDRDKYYRFEGDSAPVSRRDGGGLRQVVPVTVIPRDDLGEPETLFEGEMDLDPASYAVVRLFGRFRVVGRARRGGLLHFADMFEPTVTLVDLENQQLPGGLWVPLVERFEIQAASSLSSGYGAARRVISRFHEVEPLAAEGIPVAIAASTSGYVLTSAPGDSLRSFRNWYARAGSATDAVSEADFSRYRPDRLQPAGRPFLAVQGLQSGDFLRFNRIEGLFTGLSLMAHLRDAAPGLTVRAAGGYGWSEQRGRGMAGAAWEKGIWRLEAGGARTLDVTNKFRNQFDNPALGAMIGRDPWDYLEREGGGAAVLRALEPTRGGIVRLELARVTDRQVVRNMEHGLSGARLRINRNIAPGSYWRARGLVDWNPDVSPLFARDGVGFRGEIEAGSGDLDYTRVEGRVVLRKSLTRFFFIARLHAGAVLATDPPPQQLFELGGPAGLPGYDYKEFAGDRAALFRTRLSYPLPFLAAPIRIGSGITLPSLAPAISIGFQGGFTDARSGGGLAAVRALGDKYDDKTGELVTDPVTGEPLPAAVATDKVRMSVDIRIGFFGDALAVGLARALERGRKTKLVLAFGRQF
ncbi:MAG TPA: hypothetical protein VGQ17_14790 [Gemmatimonadales bacterium]|nr:hypothetical protein [Gemmatimonadales bacterium]